MPDVSSESSEPTVQLADPSLDTGAPLIGALPESRLRRVAAHIDGNLHRALPLADLGAVVHMSPFHFARLFKRATGLSPHRFILQRRIAAAAVLLADSSPTIKTVARAVGFATASHFATTFRRVTGMTPTDYRRHHPFGTSAADVPAASTPTANASVPPSSGEQI